MPIDLTVSNSIIQAYLAGQSLRRQREQDAIAAANQIEEQKRYQTEQGRLDKQEGRAAEQDKRTQGQFDLNALVTGLNLETTLQDKIAKGILPGGFEDIPSEGPTPEGQPKAKTKIITRAPGANPLLPETVQGRTPESIKEDEYIAAQRINELENSQFEAQQSYASGLRAEAAATQFENDLFNNREERANRLLIAQAQAAKTGTTMSPLAQAILNNPSLLYDKTLVTNSTQKGILLNELAKLGFDFETSELRIAKGVANRGIEVLNDIQGLTPGSRKVQTGLIATLSSQLPGQKAYGDAALIKRLSDLLALPEIETFRGLGPLSDADREFLKAIGTTLQIGLPQADFDKEIRRVRQIFDKAFKATNPSVGAVNPDLDMENLYNNSVAPR